MNINTLHDKALEESEKAKPSSEPSFWAKRSCKDCYGRGIVGKNTLTLPGNNKTTFDLLCVCSKKNFKKWRDAWIKNWLVEEALMKKFAENNQTEEVK